MINCQKMGVLAAVIHELFPNSQCRLTDLRNIYEISCCIYSLSMFAQFLTSVVTHPEISWEGTHSLPISKSPARDMLQWFLSSLDNQPNISNKMRDKRTPIPPPPTFFPTQYLTLLSAIK